VQGRTGALTGEANVATFRERILRAAKLDSELYEEVEADTSATGQATLVVVLAALAAGIGNFRDAGGLGGFLSITLVALVAWYIWAFLTYFIGTRILPEPQTRADMGELLRTIGFSSSPGLIRVLGIVPGLTNVVFFAAAVWMLVAMVIAVRQALDYNGTMRAIGVCIIGWMVQAIILLFPDGIVAWS
jgi:hypothetical protein